MTEHDIAMVLEISRTILRKATPEQILSVLNDPNSKIANARKIMIDWAGKSESAPHEEMIEQRRAELLAVLDICEPLLSQFTDDV